MGSVGVVIAARAHVGLTLDCLRSLWWHTMGFRLYLFDGVPAAEVSRAWNRGLRLAAEDGCDVAVVLNNDTQVTAGWLAPLVEGCDAFDLVGPASDHAGGHPVQERDGPDGPGPRTGYTAVPALNGFCLAARMAWWQWSGGFDETRFLGNEDELIARTQARCAVAHASFVWHVGAATRRDQ